MGHWDCEGENGKSEREVKTVLNNTITALGITISNLKLYRTDTKTDKLINGIDLHTQI